MKAADIAAGWVSGSSVPLVGWSEEGSSELQESGLDEEKGTGRQLCSDDLLIAGGIHQTNLNCPLMFSL